MFIGFHASQLGFSPSVGCPTEAIPTSLSRSRRFWKPLCRNAATEREKTVSNRPASGRGGGWGVGLGLGESGWGLGVGGRKGVGSGFRGDVGGCEA